MVLMGVGQGWRQDTTEGTEDLTNLGDKQSGNNPGHTEIPSCPYQLLQTKAMIALVFI